ncbi:MAG: F0F1 ATP synthase subunit B [Planctomycetota bacterium]|mgnify:CR=1 FL=1|nr:MAG: F0F1 ATP synthase subunit B [Planctomycetota bacterium]
MNIDWFTFAAQIVNFLVLVALLRWLLYGPIVGAMQKREETIANRLEEADQKREEAEVKVHEYEDKSQQLDQKRDELFRDARHEAHEEQQRLLNEAKQEIDRRREQWQDELRREQEEFLSDLRRQAGELALQAARHTLSQLADSELEQWMFDAFVSRLEQLDSEQREEIRHHLGNGDAEVLVRSAFDVPDKERERLSETIRKSFDGDAEVSFDLSDDMICGVELDVSGYTFGWNVKDFLHHLEAQFFERLRENQ